MGNSNANRPVGIGLGFKLELKPGCRIQLTSLGAERCRKLQTRGGTILGEARNANGFRIQFDGVKRPQSLHRTYIMPFDEDEPVLPQMEL
jgi:hypothetical protein